MENESEVSHSSPETAVAAGQNPSSRGTGAAVLPRARPCDICRKRKSRCVREPGQDKCVLCTFHSRACTFVERPQRRKRPRVVGGSGEGGVPAAPAIGSSAGAAADAPGAAQDAATTIPPPPPAAPAAAKSKSLLDRTLGLHRSTHSRHVGSSSLHDSLLVDDDGDDGNEEGRHDGSHHHVRRVSPTTLFSSRHDHPSSSLSFSTTTSQDEADLDDIESIVSPHGPALVDLYFRIVHPSYPILHKGVFLEKYARSYREFSPPLLAAVYLLAMDWWDYDGVLSSSTSSSSSSPHSSRRPDSQRLIQAATRTMSSVVHRPKLSTIQAGLLILQQRSSGEHSSSSWVLTTQLVGVSEELGLHVDCSNWRIPEWEKGLRRRLGWAMYMQDKWGALIHGRPSHIVPSTWGVLAGGTTTKRGGGAGGMRRLTLEDFPESAADQDDREASTEVDKGRRLFIHLARLTEIMGEALGELYGFRGRRQQEREEGEGEGEEEEDDEKDAAHSLLELTIKPLAIKLRSWAAEMPSCLQMDDVGARKLCSNGLLHLSYYATEMMMHRQVIRALHLNKHSHNPHHHHHHHPPFPSPSSPPPPPPPPPSHQQLEQVCRSAARARLEHAMAFVEKLRPEHLDGFWWFASSKCLALIGVFAGLLFVTSHTEEEAGFYRRKLDDFRWSLKVRAKSSGFIRQAEREMQDALGGMDLGKLPKGVVRENRRREMMEREEEGYEQQQMQMQMQMGGVVQEEEEEEDDNDDERGEGQFDMTEFNMMSPPPPPPPTTGMSPDNNHYLTMYLNAFHDGPPG